MSERTTYQATYRRTERALPMLIGVLVLLFGGIAGIIFYEDRQNFETLIFSLAGCLVIAMLSILVQTFRVHQWSVAPDGVHVHEKPKVPLTGLSRRAVISFSEIASLRNVESGFDILIEIVMRDGRRYRMPQALIASERGRIAGIPDPNARLDEFAAMIRATAERAGRPLPATAEGLSFWNTFPGLFFLLIMFAISIAITGTVAVALWDGFRSTQARQGEMAAILLLLPFGAAYLLWKSIRRRRDVLSKYPEA